MSEKVNFLRFFENAEPLNASDIDANATGYNFNSLVVIWYQEFWKLREKKQWPKMSFTKIFYYDVRDSINKLQKSYYFNEEQLKISENSLKKQFLILFWNNYKDFVLSLIPGEKEQKEFIEKTIGNNKFDYTTNTASYLLFIIYQILQLILPQTRRKVFNYIKNNFESYLFDKIANKVSSNNKRLLTNIEKVINTKLSKKVVLLLSLDAYQLQSINVLNKNFEKYILEKYGFNLSNGTYFNNPFFTQFFFKLFDEDSHLRGKYDKTNLGAWNSINPLIILQSIFENESKQVRDKLFDFIFIERINEEKYTKVVRKNNLWIDLCFESYFKHLNQILAREVFKENIPMDMCVSYHPFIKADDYKITNGKNLFETFFKKTFHKNGDKVLSIVKDLNSYCKYRLLKNSNWKDGRIRDLFLKYEIGFESFKNFINIQCPDFEKDEYVLERFYILFNFVKEHAKNYNDVINAFMSDFVDSISYTYGYEPIKKVSKIREKNYKLLKCNCKKIGFKLDDKFKNNYIISLLDNSCATISEKMTFPELEMLGDKIFNFTILKMVYDDCKFSYEEYKKDSQKFKPNIPEFQVKWSTLISSDTQQFIAKTLNLSELYISINPKKNKKYEHNQVNDEIIYWSANNSVIADSLEMIIGTYAKQEGILKAIKFCKQLIRKAFNTNHLYYMFISERQSFFNYNEINFIESEFSDFLYDLIAISSFGCETKEQRKVLSKKGFMHNSELCDEIFNHYLNNGLEKTINNFKTKIVNEIMGKEVYAK